jgi:hypothetical protein
VRWSWLPAVLKAAGLPVVVMDGAETRGRDDGVDSPGVVWHHTVTGTNWTTLAVNNLLAYKGNATTPPPLCNVGTERDGTHYIVATGVANHAGAGSWNGVTGNRSMIGFEMYNLGTAAEPWSPAQLDSVRRATAAILFHVKKSEAFLCGHKEWAPARKSDPHSLDMAWERSYIKSILPGGSPPIILPPQASYPDLTGHWAEVQARKMIERGIMVGDGKLWYPDEKMTRAEFAYLLVTKGKKILEMINA